ncbi:MAG: tetratricopeptide repeat protein [Anaerolineales bacterium]|nr:tetratricopeptide repeat protein [Anaerolineales bacterium]
MELRGSRFDPAAEPPRLTLARTAAYAAVILVLLGVYRLLDHGILRSPFAPPPTPTRMALSFAEEGKAFFEAGILDKAIEAYQKAVAVDPRNPELWAELARIQTYSSELMLSAEQKEQRLKEAKASIETSICPDEAFGRLSLEERRSRLQETKESIAALLLSDETVAALSPAEQRDRLQEAQNPLDPMVYCDPDFAEGYAIRTLVLDWYANTEWMDSETRDRTLAEAYQASAKALLLDPSNALALAFRAEVLVDQANWSAALDVGAQAAALGPEVMDVHRAYAYVLESNGYYERAVTEYLEAIRLNSNLPFLYIRLGANYRKLGEIATDPGSRDAMIEKAIEAFARAADLNPKDPIPYLSIAQTYANQGDFFAAERNAQKALSLDNTDPFLYGRLGVIYYKAKNYETAITVLRCAIRGCAAEDNEAEGVDVVETLKLEANSVDVYYTYGSVLSFYGATEGNCAEAAAIFAELRASPYYDTTVETIIREGEAICAAFARTPTPKS